jgi:hypothetical protein
LRQRLPFGASFDRDVASSVGKDCPSGQALIAMWLPLSAKIALWAAKMPELLEVA